MPAFGVALRNFTPPGESPDFGSILKMASRAEEMGFSIAWTWDHILLGSRRVFPILEPVLSTL